MPRAREIMDEAMANGKSYTNMADAAKDYALAIDKLNAYIKKEFNDSGDNIDISQIKFRAIVDNINRELILIKPTKEEKEVINRKCKIFHYSGHGLNLKEKTEENDLDYKENGLAIIDIDTDEKIKKLVKDNSDLLNVKPLPGSVKEAQQINYLGNYVLTYGEGKYKNAGILVPLEEIENWKLVAEVLEFVKLHQIDPFNYDANVKLFNNSDKKVRDKILEVIDKCFYKVKADYDKYKLRENNKYIILLSNQTSEVLIDNLKINNRKQTISVNGDLGILIW